MPIGRPTKYTPELQEALCDALRQGMTVEEACKSVGIQPSSYYGWTHHYPEFLEAVTRARIERAVAWVDRAVEETLRATDKESAHIARVRADIMLRAAQMSDPARFATHQKVQHDGAQPVKIIELAPEEPS